MGTRYAIKHWRNVAPRPTSTDSTRPPPLQLGLLGGPVAAVSAVPLQALALHSFNTCPSSPFPVRCSFYEVRGNRLLSVFSSPWWYPALYCADRLFRVHSLPPWLHLCGGENSFLSYFQRRRAAQDPLSTHRPPLLRIPTESQPLPSYLPGPAPGMDSLSFSPGSRCSWLC